jgi:hypothetical protein
VQFAGSISEASIAQFLLPRRCVAADAAVIEEAHQPVAVIEAIADGRAIDELPATLGRILSGGAFRAATVSARRQSDAGEGDAAILRGRPSALFGNSRRNLLGLIEVN